jgi:hypothetical protein
MISFKYIVLILVLLFRTTDKHKTYIIVAGDISCKACVIELHHYLYKNVKKEKLSVAFRDKGSVILNAAGPAYFKEELPKAHYIFLDNALLFPAREKYPYLLKIVGSDTLKMPYDSLFLADGLNTKYLR